MEVGVAVKSLKKTARCGDESQKKKSNKCQRKNYNRV